MPVLYGVFLYMGVASLNGVQVSSRGTQGCSNLGYLVLKMVIINCSLQGFFYNSPAFPFSSTPSFSFPEKPREVGNCLQILPHTGWLENETKGKKSAQQESSQVLSPQTMRGAFVKTRGLSSPQFTDREDSVCLQRLQAHFWDGSGPLLGHLLQTEGKHDGNMIYGGGIILRC